MGNKFLFTPVVKAQRKEPPMNACLAALVKSVSELRKAGLKVCHCIEEFHHRQIRPLGRRDKYAYKYPWMADPNYEPVDGKFSILSLKRWGYPDLTFLLSCIALSQGEIDGFMGQLFDKDPPTVWRADLPLPYSSENLPSSVRATVFSTIPQPAINISLCLVIQDLYPTHEIDVEPSMKTTMFIKSLLAMMSKVGEHLRLRHSLPTRSDQAWWRSLTPQLPIRLLPLLPLAVDRRRNMLCLGLSASKTKL
jgi:hypothetical protein